MRNRLALIIACAVMLISTSRAQQQDLSDLFKKVDDLNAAVARLKVISVVIPPVPANSLQIALDLGPAGTTIELQQGAEYVGNYILRKKEGTLPITIRTAGITLPEARITMAETRLAKLRCLDCLMPTLQAEPGTHDVNIIGVQFLGNTKFPDRALILFGFTISAMQKYNSISQHVSNITLDRVQMTADPATGGHLGVSMNGINMKLTRSDLRGFWERGRDSQAVNVNQGPGPLLIEDNYLEGSGENFIAGGDDPAIQDAVPSDITVRGNTFFKPLEWKKLTGSVKNLFELKNARRVLVEYNTFENNWIDSQAGSAIVFTVRNQDGGCPWCVVEDVDFRWNVVKNVEGNTFNILGTDYNHPSQITKRLKIRNNLLINVANGVAAIAPMEGLEISHNTFTGIKGRFLSLDASIAGQVITGLVVRDNVAPGGLYGIAGAATTVGTPSLERFAPDARFTNNVIENNVERNINYPGTNYKVSVGGLASRLSPRFVYLPATGEVSSDGLPLGVDITELERHVKW